MLFSFDSVWESVMQPLGLKMSGFSIGRFLGSWLGIILTPLWPMLKWIFSPFFPAGNMPSGSISVSMVLEFNRIIQHLDAATLLTRILPQLLLCMGVCILFSTAFGWLGGSLEHRLRHHKA